MSSGCDRNAVFSPSVGDEDLTVLHLVGPRDLHPPFADVAAAIDDVTDEHFSGAYLHHGYSVAPAHAQSIDTPGYRTFSYGWATVAAEEATCPNKRPSSSSSMP